MPEDEAKKPATAEELVELGLALYLESGGHMLGVSFEEFVAWPDERRLVALRAGRRFWRAVAGHFAEALLPPQKALPAPTAALSPQDRTRLEALAKKQALLELGRRV